MKPDTSKTLPWWPNEIQSAGPYLTSEDVARYDRKANFDPRSEVELLERLGLNESHAVVDFGSGTGTFAVAIAPLCKTVTAVDIAPEMIEAIQAKARALGLNNVTGVCGGLLSYESEAISTDFIYCRNVLHHLSDFWKTLSLARLYAMLKPGGVLRLRDIAFSVNPENAVSTLEHWFSNASQTSDVGWTRAELEREVREEFFTYTWLLELMLEKVGFTIEEREVSPSGIFAGYACRK